MTGLLRRCALLGLALTPSGCSRSAHDAPRAAWSPVAGIPDAVQLDTAGIEWIASDARVRLRTTREPAAGGVAAFETRHDVSCARSEIRDLGTRAIGGAGDVVADSAVPAPAWIPASRHPTLQPLLPALCARLSRLHPRGLDKLLGSDRP